MSESTPPPDSKKPARASQAEVEARVDEVLRIRLDGAQLHDVVEYAKAQGWSVTPRQCARYIAQADELLHERRERKRDVLIARHIAQREAIFARAVNSGDLRTALSVLDSLAKLQGLYSEPGRDLEELAKDVTGATLEDTAKLAVVVLRELLTSRDEDTRHRAAAALIEMRQRQVEEDELRQRLEELEKLLKREGKP